MTNIKTMKIFEIISAKFIAKKFADIFLTLVRQKTDLLSLMKLQCAFILIMQSV